MHEFWRHMVKVAKGGVSGSMVGLINSRVNIMTLLSIMLVRIMGLKRIMTMIISEKIGQLHHRLRRC